jgi:flagellar biosynthesis/type III secretory pathway M-ring protein FliF/YscJ
LLALFLILRALLKRKTPGVELPGELPAPTADQLQMQLEGRLAEQAALRQKQENEALNALKLPPVTKKTEVLTKHIADQAKKDAASMAHVVRAWLAESGDEVKRT